MWIMRQRDRRETQCKLGEVTMRQPVIGITIGVGTDDTMYAMRTQYVDATEEFGGIPLLLPCKHRESCASARRYADCVHGVLLGGGPDVDPTYFGEEPLRGHRRIDPARDAFELELARIAFLKGVPVLGICRGIQVMNIADGGDIYQDIYNQTDSRLAHEQDAPRSHPTHSVEVCENTGLAHTTGAAVLHVNSYHHQAVRSLGTSFVLAGIAKDGVTEAIESSRGNYALGVQWHPEHMLGNDACSRAIFSSFIEAAARFGLGRSR